MRKSAIYTVAGLAVLGIFFVLASVMQEPSGVAQANTKPIRIGILHSLTGTMSFSEKAVADATLMAAEEINERGGVLGRRIEPVIADGASDWPTFAREAERLITQEKVITVFGCWTSASRKTVKPVFEKYNHLLFYPVQYEGFEESPNIIYTGSIPNQQLIPATQWSFDNLGKRFYLVGSDYIFPHMAHDVMRIQIAALGGEVAGESYILLGNNDINAVAEDIIAKKPDVILNTINGDTNLHFFKMLRDKNLNIPVMSFSIGEAEVKLMGSQLLAGHYATWTYFQSIDSQVNTDFVQRFKKKYGNERVVNDPVEAAYAGVYLWAQAVTKAGSEGISKIREALRQQIFDAPQGSIMIDPRNNHAWKTVRIGKIQQDGQFSIVWASADPVRPIPYLETRSREQWEQAMQKLYLQWHNNWANPGDTPTAASKPL